MVDADAPTAFLATGNTIKLMKTERIEILTVICLIGALIFECYWIAKKVSYEWWYEDMVQETVRDMVKPEYLQDSISSPNIQGEARR